MKGRPDDWTNVVRANWRHVTAYIVSSDHPSCLKMAKDEVAFVNRVMHWVPLDAIESVRPAGASFMAVVVCPGDDLQDLAWWAQEQEADRVHFYLHKDTDTKVLAPWRDAGLPLARVEAERFTTYGKMHAKLGLDLSDQVYGDFAP